MVDLNDVNKIFRATAAVNMQLEAVDPHVDHGRQPTQLPQLVIHEAVVRSSGVLCPWSWWHAVADGQ